MIHISPLSLTPTVRCAEWTVLLWTDRTECPNDNRLCCLERWSRQGTAEPPACRNLGVCFIRCVNRTQCTAECAEPLSLWENSVAHFSVYLSLYNNNINTHKLMVFFLIIWTILGILIELFIFCLLCNLISTYFMLI